MEVVEYVPEYPFIHVKRCHYKMYRQDLRAVGGRVCKVVPAERVGKMRWKRNVPLLNRMYLTHTQGTLTETEPNGT